MSGSSERWDRVGALFGEIVRLEGEERGRRVHELAAEEPELGAELEGLLAADGLADDVLAPLDRLASELSLSPSSTTSPVGDEPTDPYGFVGETIAHYRVEAALGGGGMGIVYRAEDLQLRRTVALKFLPPVWNLDSRFKERFLEEARAAAALDHPNVCTVYEIGETDQGQLFIAMAFYEGESLRRKLAGRPAPIIEAIEIAIQAARGLAAAHDRGIAHRDIKPANLLVTPDGTVKILDFGLATSRDSSAPESAPAMGTVSYMAPEQVRGEPGGEAADLWALGVLLYEMVTGRRPFAGGSRDAIFDAVLHTEPDPPDGLRPGIPPGLAALTLRLLAKNPADRPGAEAVLDALLVEADRIDPRTTSLLVSLRGVVRRRPWTVAAAGTAVVAASVLFAVVAAPAVIPGGSALLPGQPPVDALPTFSLEGASPVVADAGVQVNPAVSPDGLQIAYVRMREPDVAQVYLQPVDGGQPRLLSGGLMGTHWAPRWSPDGTRLAFTSWTAEGLTPDGSWGGRVAIYLAEVPDGDRELLLTALTGPDPMTLAWSPDGRRLAYTLGDTIAIVDVASGRRLQALPVTVQRRRSRPHALDWSPDGSKIAFACCNPHYWLMAGDFAATAPNNLFVLDLARGVGEVRQLTDDVTINASPRWLPDSRHLLFVSNRTGSKDVFVLDATVTGELRQVTSGINSHTIDLGPDGELFYSVVNVNGNVWSVPLGLDQVATARDMEPVTTGRHDIVEFFDVSDDGRTIAFDSNREGNQNIWVGPIGGLAKRVTEHPADDWDPEFSPDGSRLTFYSVRNGNRDVFVMNTDGSGLVQVTTDPAQDWWPSWVSDSTLLFTSNRSGEAELYEAREAPDGSWGTPRRLTHDGGGWPIVSPDRTKVLYLRPPAPPGDRRYILDLGRGASAPARELSYTMVAWSRDSRSSFSAVREPDGSWLISSRPLEGGDPTPVVRLESADHGLQAGHDRLFFHRREFESDIWRMRLVRDR